MPFRYHPHDIRLLQILSIHITHLLTMALVQLIPYRPVLDPYLLLAQRTRTLQTIPAPSLSTIGLTLKTANY